jgi:peptidoglycan LD-endopeptidase LytH
MARGALALLTNGYAQVGLRDPTNRELSWHHGGVSGRLGAILVGATACAVVIAGCSSPGNREPAAGTATSGASPAAPGPASASEASPTPAEPTPAAPGPSATSPGPATERYVFPVDGKSGYAHTHHDYPASDIIAPCGSVVRAATGGVVLEVSRQDRFDPANPRGADKGGLSVSVLGDDGARYYGSHFSAIDATVQPGVRVQAGTRLGLVGRTGNTNGTCHLHFGLSPVCGRTGDWWIRRGVIWPWPYLDAWRAGTTRSPAPETTTWQNTHGCPPEPKA